MKIQKTAEKKQKNNGRNKVQLIMLPARVFLPSIFYRILILTLFISFSISVAKAQSAYRGGKGDGYASAIEKGVSINGAQPENKQLKIFPNPLTGRQLKVTFPMENSGKVLISLFDISGRQCFFDNPEINKNLYIIDLPYLAGGMYIITVKTDKEELKEKLILLKE